MQRPPRCRASLHGQIVTEFDPAELKRLAEQYNMTPDEIKSDEEMQPYFNIKYVLVEEEGKLKVGYFEFRPPSIWD